MDAAAVGGAFLSAFVQVVLFRLASPQFANFLTGNKLDVNLIQRLKNTLYAVEAVSHDAELKQIKDSAVNKWLDDLKDTLYLADDILDHISTKAASTQKNKKVSTKMVRKLEDIVARLETILKRKDILGLQHIPTHHHYSWRTPSTSLNHGSDIFGRNQDIEAILKLLLHDGDDDSDKISVIPIVGMGGVGKTTLAQTVYNHENIKQKFDVQAWVCVSDDFDVLKVTKAIAEEVRSACNTNNLNILQQDLKDKLTGKKFLIVLDDVWTEDYDSWNFLIKPLRCGAKGSKILVTTRSQKVVSMVQTFQAYSLEQLSDEDCWSVFANHACLSQEKSTQNMDLEKIGEEIVRKCKGLPLAAQSLGDLLQRKRDIRDWKKILNSHIWEIDEKESEMIPALTISYHYLPPYLKTIGIKREIGSFVLESHIIGREDNKNEILSLLRQPHENQNVSFIAIVGISGLGKTTLAQLVYNDWEVQNLFEKRMWVCVSHKFDVKTIVKTMLESLTESKIGDTLSLENLQNMLCENLTGKRYLLVLDDVWNENYEIWDQLRTYLMYGAQDSKVVVTTRSYGVAQTMGASVSYALCCLNQEESWILLKNIATYGDKTKIMNQTLESIGRKIVERCSGVPLEIRTLGGLLQDKSEAREWKDVLEDMLWKSGEHEAVIMHVLHLSYQNLSPLLRQCFAYCSIYPKGWQIEKDELVQLWMAQGYLEFSFEQNLFEDIGNQLVKIFLMKSIFQDAKMDEDGDIHSFKMHDLTHDLAMQVAGNDCFYLDSKTTIPAGSPIHISLEPNAVHLLDSLDGSMLRTLILLSSEEDEELNWDALSVISNFKSLRALKLSYSSLSNLSGSIGNLKHLRYLNLSSCRGLGNLFKSTNINVFLQTLILMPNENVVFSTMAISKLINLRHLHISDWEASEDKNPTKFKRMSMQQNKSMFFSNWLSPHTMTNLVEISLFLCGSFRCLPPLECHPFLKSLHVSFLEDLEYVYYEEVLPLTFFPSLENLTFWFCGKLKGWCRMLDDLNHPNSSSHLSLPPFPRLSQLSIIGCQMLTQMPTFPNLENRLELFDSSVETLEATLNIAASQYQNDSPPLSMLKSLHLDRMSFNLNKTPKEWMQNLTSLQHLQIDWFTCETIQEIGVWFKDNHNYFPSLQKLSIHNCEDLEALPDWICNLQSLTHLSIHDCINLASLPEEMFLLSKLQTLEIIGCPLLIDECET